MCNQKSNHPKKPGRPLRLPVVFSAYQYPVFFVTFGTQGRQKLLANDEVHSRFRRYCGKGSDYGVQVGRYVIMPDHIHLFAHVSGDIQLGAWVKGLKRFLASGVESFVPPLWQRGFFDHLLRNEESALQKWEYVRQNPVRAELCQNPEDWLLGGEINEW